MWSKKVRRPSGAEKTPKRCWIQSQRIRCPAYGIWRSSPRCSTVSPRVSAVLKLKVDDYYHNGARRRLRLHEKGGKEHEMPVHHLLEQILNEYIVAAGSAHWPGSFKQYPEVCPRQEFPEAMHCRFTHFFGSFARFD